MALGVHLLAPSVLATYSLLFLWKVFKVRLPSLSSIMTVNSAVTSSTPSSFTVTVVGRVSGGRSAVRLKECDSNLRNAPKLTLYTAR